MSEDKTIEELRVIAMRASERWYETDRGAHEAIEAFGQLVNPDVLLALINYIDLLRAKLADQAAHGPVTPAAPTFTQTIRPQRFDRLPDDPWSLHHAVTFAASSPSSEPALTVEDETLRHHESAAEASPAPAPDPDPTPSTSSACADSDSGYSSGSSDSGSSFDGGGGDSGGGGSSSDY